MTKKTPKKKSRKTSKKRQQAPDVGVFKNAENSEEFDTHYSELFGKRWQTLRPALCASATAGGSQLNLRELRALALSGDYWLDKASCLLAQLLAERVSEAGSREEAEETEEKAEPNGPQIWDMCAAPGGKMLRLALAMQGRPAAGLLASDVSIPRFARLQQQRALLPAGMQQQVVLQRADACLLALKHKAAGRSFDAILLDAPCSSERHVLAQSPELLSRWRTSRSKRNGRTQLALLCAALDCLAPGGHLLYATCALSPAENSAVVARALKKRPLLGVHPAPFEVTDYPEWTFESLFPESGQALGYSILPDRNAGCGPLYFCLLHRSPNSKSP
ncbi:hypothetical protein P0082_11110 [Candidatus Haliotispira prima]|uniref:SAM-dependent MTase RsmB/NOP-type domain-containing protein n=1 Tax=Candidatus Haliotispira prima TaxID=3034016 RepID=A0ABY8MG98_9SPIO|nr:hypothetical protein P0082_11110 [Candidatus Haliotispira prima]